MISDANLSKHRIDRSDLHARSSAQIAKLRRGDVVFTVWLNQWQTCEALDDLVSGLRPHHALKQLLENQARRHHHIGTHQGVFEGSNFRRVTFYVTAQSERPNAGVDQKSHDRERSDL